ncbi:PIN domain-containing protein [Pseudofrankia inefficax]|uniref:PilT protein domain protein n=1 Tax=Pseudofrankia inefficax (strain DSM 45817 / CECT 9037 / DDB 130130 / EuI1c) TaxID=298654 RepID=E3J1A6_PSEI1|nr:PIN domain-containing protein [Pseudofrankia inefficax]ADP80427.1 PilT protein domain protein [Pseudofrankia inefficax]
MTTVVLDSGALIALERRAHRVLTIIDELAIKGFFAHIPAGVLAQVWRGSARQHAVIGLVRSDTVRVEPLTESVAMKVGRLLAVTGTSDVVDGHVALLARDLGAPVVTSDPKDIHVLDPGLTLITV